MDYQQIMIELPALSDEAAASLQTFIYGLMNAVDEHYYRQIQRHYADISRNEPNIDHLIEYNLDESLF